MMKNQGKVKTMEKKEENYEKSKKNIGKRGKYDEKLRKIYEKPRKNNGKQGKNEEIGPTTKKNKFPKQEKKSLKNPHPYIYIFNLNLINNYY
jgi:hypothetical protein